jgi:hypothetical protein
VRPLPLFGGILEEIWNQSGGGTFTNVTVVGCLLKSPKKGQYFNGLITAEPILKGVFQPFDVRRKLVGDRLVVTLTAVLEPIRSVGYQRPVIRPARNNLGQAADCGALETVTSLDGVFLRGRISRFTVGACLRVLHFLAAFFIPLAVTDFFMSASRLNQLLEDILIYLVSCDRAPSAGGPDEGFVNRGTW